MKISFTCRAAIFLVAAGAAFAAQAGFPAARVGDATVCPMVTGIVPHVGGPIITGSTKVFICGLPAATVGSRITEVGPPGTVATGSRSVFVEGRPATFLGANTDHGGSVTTGCPSVLIAH